MGLKNVIEDFFSDEAGQQGQVTTAGRPVFQDENGESYSEKTITIQGGDGQWYNVPTVGAGGRMLDPGMLEDIYAQKSDGFTDTITGAPLAPFATSDEAVAGAQARSDGLLGSGGGFLSSAVGSVTNFLSPEAGQERRAWLSGKEEQFGNALSYALGPDLAPRVNALANVGAMVSPGADVMEARQAGSDMFAPDRSALDRAGSAAAMVGAGAMMLMPGGASSVRQGVDSLVDAGMRAYDPSQVNMFAGRNAATADTEALARAEEMLEAGAAREDVLRDTGWFRGVDGKMRFEIDDSGAKVPFDIRHGYTDDIYMDDLGTIMPHEDLSAAYPSISRIGARIDPAERISGEYQPFESRENLGLFDLQEEITARAPDTDGMTNVLLHEAQHAVQRREGFARGGSASDAFSDILSEQNSTLNNLSSAIDARQSELGIHGYRPATNDQALRGLREKYDALVGRSPSNQDAFERYQSYAGEAESRNVEARRAFTPEQRQATPPWATQDVPENAQIVRYGDMQSQSSTTRAQALPPLAPELAFMKDIYR